MSEYQNFIKSKLLATQPAGFEPGPVHSSLFPYQADAVRWAVRLGRAALFLDTGLGKTRCQVEFARQVADHTGGDVLILAPLAVAGQTVREAAQMGVEVRYCRDGADVRPGITIANYEMLAHFDPARFVGIVLDESSILKSFTGSTKRALLAAFKDTPYRLACTATPAPNDYLELGNHAEFLGVMRSNEMISRFFINDTMAAGSYRLKGHARDAFWQWVASWAVSMTKPSDMGYDDDGFALPPLDIDLRVVSTADLPAREGELFRDATLSATTLHQEMRLTAPRRAQAVAELVASEPGEAWLIWCNTNYEADELLALIPDATEVRGNEKPEQKERKLNDFTEGHARILISKPSLCGFGMNWQHCARMAFMGLSYSYEQFYQAARRCWRFGQTRSVTAHVVIADSEGSVLETIQRKEQEHRQMQREMAAAISAAHKDKDYEILDSHLEIAEGEGWKIYLGDCVQVAGSLDEGSIDFSVYSPPFSNLYIYSDSIHDMGNTRDHEEFFDQYKYLIRELYRITRDGRLTAIHCKDLPLYKNRDGAAGLWDFPGRIIREYEAAGWTFHSRVTIWKDPVIEMQRTKNHGLLYKQLCKDSAASRQGMADYIIVMRKWGDESKWEPVTRGGERFFDYIGSTQSGPGKRDIGKARTEKERERLYSIAVWQRYASPVWFDIQQTNVLNIQQARESQDEKHIAPLQLDVIERCVELWSNPGDLVFSPFTGIGSEGFVSVQMGRRFVGAELKRSYWEVACRNLQDAKKEQGDMFAEAV